MKLFKKKTETLEKEGKIMKITNKDIEREKQLSGYTGKMTLYIEKQLEKKARTRKEREKDSVEHVEKQAEQVRKTKKKSGKKTLKTMKRGAKKVSGFLMDVSERFEESQIASEVKRKPVAKVKARIKKKPAKKKPVKKEVDIMDIILR